MIDCFELVVIGGGPAGIEAAIAAAEFGVQVALIDGYSQLGGQYFKQLSPSMHSNDHTPRQKQAEALFRRFKDSSVTSFSEATVWSAEAGTNRDEWKLFLQGAAAPAVIHTKALVIACGVYDRPLPFPGWTLPGVMTAGSVQILLKTQRILAGKRFLFSGTGPLQLAAAARLINAGAEVIGVLEANRFGVRELTHAPAMIGQWEKIREGWDYWRTLHRTGVKIKRGFAAIAAKGDREVEEVTVARLDKEMKPVPGTEETLKVDTLVIGYGFQPCNELTRMLKCEHEYVPEQMYHIPRCNEHMQTCIRTVFAAGDGAGVGGVQLALIEGRIAGLAAAHTLGWVKSEKFKTLFERDKRILLRERRFAKMLTEVFRIGPGLLSLAEDDTLICRCEEISKKEIIDAVKTGCDTLIWTKRMTRAGMGMCQGRVCGQWIARLIAEQKGEDPSNQALDTIRPPIRPIPLNSIEVPENG